MVDFIYGENWIVDKDGHVELTVCNDGIIEVYLCESELVEMLEKIREQAEESN